MPEFSDQQLTILRLACDGRTNQEIADALDMGLRTVELRLAECRKALGLKRERQLIAWAGRNVEASLTQGFSR